METIWLQRPSGDIPWGFRLQGGREFAQPLSVQRVTPGSVAANSNSLAPGDLVLKIGNVNATNVTHNEAQEVICGATNILQLTIKKGPGISAPMSPTPLGSGQFSSPLEQHDKYSTLPDYRIGTGYQALNNASSGYINAQESSAYDMRQLEQTPPMSGYSTMPVRGSANKQNTDGFRPVQQSQQNKYPYKSTSGIQLQLNPQTQSNIRNDNSYNQRGDYNDGGSYSQPMSPVQYTNGNRTESPYQRQTSVGSTRQDPYSGHPQSYFKKPTPFSPGYADNYTDNSPQPPRAQRQTSSGSQPGNVYDATISPGFQSRSYISDEPPPTPPPPVNYQPEPYSRPYEPDFDRPTYQRQPSNPQSASYNYNSSPYEQSQNDYNAYQSRQNRDVYVDTSDNQYQRQGSRPYEPQPPLQPPYQRPSNPSYYDDRGSAPMTPTRLQGQPSFGSSTQYGSPDPYASPQHFSRQSSRDQQQQSQPQYSRQSSNQSQPLSRQFSREQHSDLPTYTNPISPPGNTINSFEDILSPFENFQNSNYCDKLFSRSPDARGGDPDSGVSMSSDTPRSNQSSTYSPPHSYPGAYDRGQGLLRPAHQAPPPPPVTPPPPPPPPPPSDWASQKPRRKLPPENPHDAQGDQQMPDKVLNTMLKHGGTQKPFSYVPSGADLKEFKERAKQRRQPRQVMPRGYVGPSVEDDDAPAEPQRPQLAKPKPGAMPNPDTGVYKHAQYNSPLRVYSSDNARDAFNVQSGGNVDVEGVTNNYPNRPKTPPHFITLPKKTIRTPERRPSDIKDSDVYKMCKDMDAQGNKPKKPRDPLLRHNSIDDEMRFTGLHTKADIPSKAFQRLHKIAGTETKSPSPTQAQNNRQNDDEDRVGNYDEASIRYRGKHIPSPSFRLLQTLAKEEEMKIKAGSPSSRFADDDDDGMPDRLNEEDMVDKRYTGGNIPSKSFKALKMFVEDENKTASDSEGGGPKIQVVSRSRSPKVPPKPDRPSPSPIPHAPTAIKAAIRHDAPTSDF